MSDEDTVTSTTDYAANKKKRKRGREPESEIETEIETDTETVRPRRKRTPSQRQTLSQTLSQAQAKAQIELQSRPPIRSRTAIAAAAVAAATATTTAATMIDLVDDDDHDNKKKKKEKKKEDDDDAYFEEQMRVIAEREEEEERLKHGGKGNKSVKIEMNVVGDVAAATQPMRRANSIGVGESDASRALKKIRMESQEADDDDDDDDDDIAKTVVGRRRPSKDDLLPRHVRKALKYLLNHNKNMDPNAGKLAVKQYAAQHPDEKDMFVIEKGAFLLVSSNEVELVNENEGGVSSAPSLKRASSSQSTKSQDPKHNENSLLAAKEPVAKAESPEVIIKEDALDESAAARRRRRRAKNKGSSSSDQAATSTSIAIPVISIDDDVEVISETVAPLTEIMRIFPNAKVSFVEKLLAQFNNNVYLVVQEMMDKAFEKETPPPPTEKTVKQAATVKQHDFTSTTWETSELYRKHATIELINNFPYFKENCIKKLFKTVGKFHYFHTLKVLEDITNEKARLNYSVDFKKSWSYPQQRNRVDNYLKTNWEKVTKILDLPDLNFEVDLALRASTKSLPVPGNPLDEVLDSEIVWIKKKNQADMSAADSKMAEELNNEMATADGALLECGCCYDGFPFESLVQCSDGHLFCKNCLKHYVEETVFGGGRSVIKCMSGEGCQGFFPDSMIQGAVPELVFKKYSEALTRDALKAADIDDIVNCYNCSLQVSLPINCGNVLQCPSCNAETCRLCGEVAHIPLKCSEVEKKNDTSARLSVEEAMTQARVRECPKCKTRFFKTEGCNKMTCTCNSNICYICRKDITKEKYAHFCQVAHCNHSSCGKCKLYTDSVEDDRQAMRDAGIKKMNEIKSASAGDGAAAADDKGVPKIDINLLLEKNANAPKPIVVPRMVVPQFGMHAALPHLQHFQNQIMQRIGPLVNRPPNHH